MTHFRTDAGGLRARREALRETQQAFAERCGVHRTVIAKAERSQRSLTVSQLMLVADRLGIHPRDLLVKDDQAAQPHTALQESA